MNGIMVSSGFLKYMAEWMEGRNGRIWHIGPAGVVDGLIFHMEDKRGICEKLFTREEMENSAMDELLITAMKFTRQLATAGLKLQEEG